MEKTCGSRTNRTAGRFRSHLAVVLAVLVAAVSGSAQVTKVGTTGAKFLNIPAGARAAGIAGCWYNPAGAPWPGPGEPPERVIGDLRELLAMAPP